MNKPMRITLSAAILAVLAGCGAKGPLILPEKVVPIEVPAETVPEDAPERSPDSVPSVDSPEADALPEEPQAEEAVEIPVQPAKDD
jgi:predicted small lipoprotein YifL